MRRKVVKLRQFSLAGAKANSTCIGTVLETYFVVGDSHNNIRLYTFENQQEVQIYSNPTNNNNVQTEITSVALSCIEKEIFSGTNRGIINIWDMETAKAHTLLRGHSTAVNCFGVYPQEPSKLASGSYDTTVKLWDIRQKNSTATLKGHSKQINAIAISPDGNMLLSGSEDCSTRLWELRYADKPLYISNEHNGPILKVRFNPEDCMFATCSMDKTAKYFRCQEKCYGYSSSTEMIATPVTSIGYSTDGKTLFTAANDVLKSWNMYKNGLLVQTFDANWKGVQQINMIKGALMGISYAAGSLSLWVCDVQGKIKNRSQYIDEGSFVLPPITKGASRQENQNQINELQNIVGMAIQKVNNIQDRPPKENDKKIEQIQKKRAEFQKRKEELKQLELARQRERQRIRQQKQTREREEKQKKQQERQRRIQQQRLMQQRLYQDRLEREKQMQQRVRLTLQSNNNQLESTLEHDVLENSSVMNISTFVTDGVQKEKLRQIQLIGDILKDSSKFQNYLSERRTQLLPILNFWKQGRTSAAMQIAQKSSQTVLIDFTNAILLSPRFKSGITTEVGISFSSILCGIMSTNKHATYVSSAMKSINTIVVLFKDELIKIKNFNPITRVDISREERLAKYDKLIDEFLNIFKQQRLKKYNEKKKSGSTQEIYQNAAQLYKNLEEVLIKIVPKQQAEMA